MISKTKCKYEKTKNEKDLSQREIKEVFSIVKAQLAFMARNKIPPLPKQYSRWFTVFCYLQKTNKKLNDLEIKGLYKEIYNDHENENETDPSLKYISKELKNIANNLEETLSNIIDKIDSYDSSLVKYGKRIEKTSKNIKIDKVFSYINNIIQELQSIKKQNEVLKTQMQKYRQEIERLQNELSTAKTEAEMDFLTQLPNRRRFVRALKDSLRNHKEKNYPFSLIVLDIDDFKKINDTYGHSGGDTVLKEIAYILKNYLRANTVIGRLGGEEFAILIPGINGKKAKHIAERIRKVLENRSISYKNKTIKVTASFGVTESVKKDTPESIIDRADKALYKAKNSGKNTVKIING